MRTIVITTIILFTIGLVVANEGLVTKKFSQRLNHFGRDLTQWDQRYFVNSDYFYAGGPIFIYISGKLDTFELLHASEIYDFNKVVNGILFGLEHRYFGASKPTLDLSIKNLEYLTADQAVADIAHFIQHIKDKYVGVDSSKVILFGEDYGATLAVWAKQKYPHLIDGVWASSAQVRPVINHGHLTINIGQAYRQAGGDRCYEIIANAFETLDLLVYSRETDTITNAFKLCQPIDTANPNDVASLTSDLVGFLSRSVRSQSFDEIVDSCVRLITEEDDNDFVTFSKWFRDDLTSRIYCIDVRSEETVAGYREESWYAWSTASGLRQELYLQCAGLGQFATSDADQAFNPFGNSFGLEYYTKFCDAVFGDNFTDILDEENARLFTKYGGLNLKVSNVFFTQGELDPQITLGLVEDLNEDSPVVVIPLHTKPNDLRTGSPDDAEELKEAKRRAKLNLLKWILDTKSEQETVAILERLESVPF